LFGQALRGFYVPALRTLVPASQQNDDLRPAPLEINAVSRPMVDPQLADAITDRSGIAAWPYARRSSREAIRPRARPSRNRSRHLRNVSVCLSSIIYTGM
jgi:hypothetical protein